MSMKALIAHLAAVQVEDFQRISLIVGSSKRKFENNFEAIQHTDESYQILSLDYMHAGEYRCSATNTGGTAIDSKTVNVRCKYAYLIIQVLCSTFCLI